MLLVGHSKQWKSQLRLILRNIFYQNRNHIQIDFHVVISLLYCYLPHVTDIFKIVHTFGDGWDGIGCTTMYTMYILHHFTNSLETNGRREFLAIIVYKVIPYNVFTNSRIYNNVQYIFVLFCFDFIVYILETRADCEFCGKAFWVKSTLTK